MTASLPMYWRPETAAAWRGFWADVQAAAQDHGFALPDLTAPEALPADWVTHWLDPALLLSQTCSLPLRTSLWRKVTYVGSFDFDLDAEDMHCPPGYYQSVYIQPLTPDGDPVFPPPKPTRFALNGFDSQSGWAATHWAKTSRVNAVRPKPAFVVTGSHAGSLAAIAEGRADVAALDEVTWRLLQRFDPNARKVAAYGRTSASPGLPLITALGRDPAPLRAALAQACAHSDWMGHADLGGLRDFVVLDEDAYLSQPVPLKP